MALGNSWKSAATLIVGGAIGVALAPAVTPALSRLLRPAAKAGIRAGFLLVERGRLAAAELRETVEDLTAEVQAEFAEERAAAADQAAVSPAPADEAANPGVIH